MQLKAHLVLSHATRALCLGLLPALPSASLLCAGISALPPVARYQAHPAPSLRAPRAPRAPRRLQEGGGKRKRGASDSRPKRPPPRLLPARRADKRAVLAAGRGRGACVAVACAPLLPAPPLLPPPALPPPPRPPAPAWPRDLLSAAAAAAVQRAACVASCAARRRAVSTALSAWHAAAREKARAARLAALRGADYGAYLGLLKEETSERVEARAVFHIFLHRFSFFFPLTLTRAPSTRQELLRRTDAFLAKQARALARLRPASDDSACGNGGSGSPLVQPPAGLAATLRPYQLAGLRWLAGLHDASLNGILADESAHFCARFRRRRRPILTLSSSASHASMPPSPPQWAWARRCR